MSSGHSGKSGGGAMPSLPPPPPRDEKESEAPEIAIVESDDRQDTKPQIVTHHNQTNQNSGGFDVQPTTTPPTTRPQRRCLSIGEALHAFFVPSAYFDISSNQYLIISGIRPAVMFVVACTMIPFLILPQFYLKEYDPYNVNYVYETNVTYWFYSYTKYSYGEVRGGFTVYTKEYACTQVRDIIFAAAGIAIAGLAARLFAFYVTLADTHPNMNSFCVCNCLLKHRAFINRYLYPASFAIIGVCTITPFVIMYSYYKGTHYCSGTSEDTGGKSRKNEGLNLGFAMIAPLVVFGVEVFSEFIRFAFFMSTFFPRKEEAAVDVGEGVDAEPLIPTSATAEVRIADENAAVLSTRQARTNGVGSTADYDQTQG